MSDSSSDHLATIITDICICHLCKNIFKHPIILSCFHSFCSKCLDQHFSQQIPQEGPETFPCPVCFSRSATADAATTSFADQPKPDTFIANLLTVVEAFRGDKECDICQRQDDHQIASSWCVNCCDALCQECAQVHLYGRTTSNHKIISMTEFQKLPLPDVIRGASCQRCCNKHPQEVVKLFCLDCGQPVCVQCLASSHKQCDRCLPAAEARKLAQGEITAIMARLQDEVTEASQKHTPRLQDEVTEASQKYLQHMPLVNSLEDNIKQTEAEIRSVAEDLRRKISESEKALIQKLHSVGLPLVEKASDVQNMETPGNDGAKNLAAARKRMTALLQYGSDLDVLDIYHKVKGTLYSADEERSNALISDTVRLKVSFDIDDAVKTFRRDFERLGDVRVEDSGHDEGLSSWGVAVTSRDEIVVTHGRHKRVQLFTVNGSLVDHIQLNEEPRDITSFGRHDVAITVTKKQILIMTVFAKLELKRRVETQRQYDGIAFYPTLPCFLVSSLEENCIDLVTTEGNITKTFSVNKNTQESIFSCPRFVSFTKDSHFVFSDTAHNSVTCISQDGVLLFSYAPRDGAHHLKRVQGVCCDKNGNVFVADYGNSRIHLLASDGSFQRFILGRDSELRRPVALTMTTGNKLVVVQSDGMVKIFSYEGNPVHGQSREIPNGKLEQGHHRFYSSMSSSPRQAGKANRSLNESSHLFSSASSLSPHTFRSRHF